MEFQVSARKWRPQKFSELIGQEHIVRTLGNAIRLDRVAHAYLFSGTRGVGKTTTARILAKALNCLERTANEPCGKCTPCLEIKGGHCVDVQEIDGASNNGVAEVRDLIDNIQYATSSCRYKVYIIDEVHMLSKNAFNALLKTLEEPPPKVVFIFATTEMSRIPETILSRCQCFEFKPLSQKQIVRQLDLICEQEEIKIDRLSLEEIAKNGGGSMRDAQSLLDQVIAFCGQEIGSGSVEAVLGIVGQKTLETFVDHLISKDPAALIGKVQEIANSGKDLNYFCRDLIDYIRNLLVVKVIKNPASLLDEHTCDLKVLQTQSQAFHADELQQMFNFLARTEGEMKRSSLAQMIFEMAILRLIDIRPFQHVEGLIEKINQLVPEKVSDKAATASREVPAAAPEPLRNIEPSLPNDETNGDTRWERIKQEVCRKKPYLNHYLAGSRVLDLNKTELRLGFPDANTMGLMEKNDNLQALQAAVKTVCDNEVQVKLSLFQSDEPEKSRAQGAVAEKKKGKDTRNGNQKTESEIIQEALDIFGGVVVR